MTHVALDNAQLVAFSLVSLHAPPWHNESFRILRLCWIDDTLRRVRITEATELLIDIDTRVELLAHLKTLIVILQYIDSNDSGSEL